MTRALALLLLAGSLMLLVAGAMHPILPLTPEADLALIAAMPHWHAIHVALLYGTGLVVAGIWARWLAADPAVRPGLAVGSALFGLGEVLNGVTISYMTGAGTLLAQLQATGTDVRTLYQATHLPVVMAGRLGGFLVSLAAGVIATATGWQPEEPRWLVGLAWFACGAGVLGNLFAPPGHPLMLTSIAVMTVWQLFTAVRLLRRPL